MHRQIGNIILEIKGEDEQESSKTARNRFVNEGRIFFEFFVQILRQVIVTKVHI